MRFLLIALALVAGTVVPAAGAVAAPDQPDTDPAPGSLGIRLLDAPTSAAEDPRARAYIVDHVAPGAVIHRRVEVTNTTASTAPVALYAAAAAISNGVFTPGEGHAENELSSWTTMDRTSLSLPPGGRETVPVTITVPPDASPGERYAALWVEQATPPRPGGGVSLVSRVGVRIYLSVGPGGAPPSSFTIDSLTADRSPESHPVVVAQVRNTGGRALDISATLTLSDGPGGLGAGPFTAQKGATLAPGDVGQVTVVLDKALPNGPWRASVELRSGTVKETAQATIQFPEEPGAGEPVELQAGPPWLLIIAGSLLLLVVVAAVGFATWRRRSTKQK